MQENGVEFEISGESEKLYGALTIVATYQLINWVAWPLGVSRKAVLH